MNYDLNRMQPAGEPLPEILPASIRRYRNAQGGPINAQVEYIEFLCYLDNKGEPLKTIARSVSPTGQVANHANWTMRHADQLVESGNWILETDPDKPDGDYGVDPW